MSERTDISFDAALMMALRADAQRELVPNDICHFIISPIVHFKAVRHIMVAVSIREPLQRFAIHLISQLHLNGQKFLNHRIDCPAEISADRKSTNRQHYECQCRN